MGMKERRTEAIQGFFAKLELYTDASKAYKNVEANKILKDVENFAKAFLHKQNSIMSGSQNLSFEVKADEAKDFINEITSAVRTAGEYFVEDELNHERKELINTYLKGAINEIEDFAKPKYENAVKLMLQLSKIKKCNKLNDDVFEIEKYLIAGINYNDKVEKEKAGLL